MKHRIDAFIYHKKSQFQISMELGFLLLLIFFFSVVSFLFFLLFLFSYFNFSFSNFRLRLRYETENCHQATHQWTDDVEEAEGQIDESRNAKYRTLRHTACRPRHEYGGDRGRVLCASAQQFWSIASCGIFLLVDGSIHDDGEELVAHHEIEQYT